MGEPQRARSRPVPVPRWRSAGLHWHAYVTPDLREAARAPGNRAARLACEPIAAVLCQPHAVAAWLSQRASVTGDHYVVWLLVNGDWRLLGDADDAARIRVEHLTAAARGDNIYTSIQAPAGQSVTVFAEAVTAIECPHHCASTETLAEHCRAAGRA